MTTNPYPPAATPITDPDTLAAWARYEAEGKAARLMYRAIPISLGLNALTTVCACGRRTTSRYGTCRECLREERAS